MDNCNATEDDTVDIVMEQESEICASVLRVVDRLEPSVVEGSVELIQGRLTWTDFAFRHRQRPSMMLESKGQTLRRKLAIDVECTNPQPLR